MKIYTTLLQAALACALLTPAFAQSGINVSVNVPFTFRVGVQNFPAGHYTLKAAGGSALMTIQDATGKNCAATVTSRNAEESGPAEAQVIFREYGTVHYLASVRVPNSVGRTVKMSRAELESAGTRTAFLASLPATRSR